jgi:hypothetical protein
LSFECPIPWCICEWLKLSVEWLWLIDYPKDNHSFPFVLEVHLQHPEFLPNLFNTIKKKINQLFFTFLIIVLYFGLRVRWIDIPSSRFWSIADDMCSHTQQQTVRKNEQYKISGRMSWINEKAYTLMLSFCSKTCWSRTFETKRCKLLI